MSTGVVDVETAALVEKGASAPLGASVQPGGVNFSVFSRTATLIELLLFDGPNGACVTRHRALGDGASLRAGDVCGTAALGGPSGARAPRDRLSHDTYAR